MVRFNAHFDGKVIIPDEPLNLPPNRPLVVRIEAADTSSEIAGQSALEWIAEHAIESNELPADLSERHDHYLYGTPAEPTPNR